MLTIYSVGDAWYLGKVMDAIAMISGSNEGFVGASMVAALIGVFVIGFQSILKITLNIHELLVCYIIYMGCFSIQTDVVIESVYSDKTVIQKDNVPYGPAVLGSIISEIGYKLTQKMEVAFSDVHQGTLLTDPNGSQGYANALYLINNLARWSEKNGADTLPTAQNSSFAKNIRTYAMDCTTKALYLGKEFGGKEWKDLKTNSFINALGFNSDVYGTELYINNRAESYTCKEGINAIKNEFKNMLSAIDAGGNESARKEMLVNVGLCKNTQECNANIATNITDLVQNNLDALRVRNYDINDFMMAAVGMNELYTGLSLGYSSMFDKQSATMILNAVQQRNIQWGAEQNMFLQSVRPMLSFIEGLFYAISPFAAIMVMLGLFGLKIFFKYIILLIWIQLWLPIMAIANHYIMASASEAIDKLPYQGTGDNMGMSLYFYENLVQICQTKIAVGGMMMAATPVLSLMLITGSVYAMTQLTNRMSGGDHINEKMIAPDAVGTAPIMMMSPGSTNDAYTSKESGAKFKDIAIGKIIQNAMSNSHENAITSTNTLSNTLNSAFSTGGGNTKTNAIANAAIDTLRGSQGHTLNKLTNDLYSQIGGEASGITKEQVASAIVNGSLGGNVGASSDFSNSKTHKEEWGPRGGGETYSDQQSHGKGNRFGVNAGINTSASKGNSLSATQSESHQKLNNLITGISESDNASILKEVANTVTRSNSNGDSYNVNASETDQISKALQTAISESEKYNQTVSASQSINSNLTQSSLEIASRLSNKDIAKAEKVIKSIYEGNSGGDTWDALVRNMERRNHSNSSPHAHQAAIIEAMDEIKGVSDDINNEFAKLLSKYSGSDLSKLQDIDNKLENNIPKPKAFTEEEYNAKKADIDKKIKDYETQASKSIKLNDPESFYKEKMFKLKGEKFANYKKWRNEQYNENMSVKGAVKEEKNKPINTDALAAFVRNAANVDNIDLDKLDLTKKEDLTLLNNAIRSQVRSTFAGVRTHSFYDVKALAAAEDQLVTSYVNNYQTLIRGFTGENEAMAQQDLEAKNKTRDAFYNMAKYNGASEEVAKNYAENIVNTLNNNIYMSANSMANVQRNVAHLYKMERGRN